MSAKHTIKSALELVLDQVDYTSGACHVTEMVGACLPVEVIHAARRALANYKERTSGQTQGNDNSNTGS